MNNYVDWFGENYYTDPYSQKVTTSCWDLSLSRQYLSSWNVMAATNKDTRPIYKKLNLFEWSEAKKKD